MDNRHLQLDQFFIQYEKNVNSAISTGKTDVEATTEMFAESFVEASPKGIIGGKNDEEFKAKVPKGYAYYKKIGVKAMNIVAKEVTLMDLYHAMVRITWKCLYSKQDQTGNVEFDVIYFTQTLMDKTKIFAYIAGDEEKVLKDIGLI